MTPQTPLRLTRPRNDPAAPHWLGELVAVEDARVVSDTAHFHAELAQGNEWALATLRIENASQLARRSFIDAVTRAYLRLFEMIQTCDAPHLVRIWNYVPAIHRNYDDGMDQYMMFNSGRYQAFATWYGHASRAERCIPTASAIGHHADDIVIDALACIQPGRPIENPRQVSAYHYSRRYGPCPPCFARATVVEPSPKRRLLLISGTASVVGEDSRHVGDLRAQTGETLENLAALLHAARAPDESPEQCDAPTASDESILRCLTHPRVYYVREDDRPRLQRMLTDVFATEHEIEWMRADLCRSELLVEIEAMADLPHAGRPTHH